MWVCVVFAFQYMLHFLVICNLDCWFLTYIHDYSMLVHDIFVRAKKPILRIMEVVLSSIYYSDYRIEKRNYLGGMSSNGRKK